MCQSQNHAKMEAAMRIVEKALDLADFRSMF